MSNVTVEFDQSFPIKKASIKTTPMMSLKSIVVSACEKFAITDPDNYGLKYGRAKELDLSLSVRFANLPAGAKLSLIPKSAVGIAQEVTVALQTEEFGRLVNTFSVKTCFWSILEYFETEKNLNLTKRSGIPNQKDGFMKVLSSIGKSQLYMMPIVVFMNREYSTVDELMKTSLQDAGFTSGNGVLRLLYKYVPMSLKEMMINIQEGKQKFSIQSDANSVTQKSITPTVEKVETMQDSGKVNAGVKEDDNMQVDLPPQETPLGDEPKDDSLPQELDRQITVFEPIPDNYQMPKFDLPDTFFELSSMELKYLLSNIEYRKSLEENAGFKTKMMREREQAAKAQKYPKTCIRVRFPDKYVFQITFLSQEKIQQLYDIIGQSLENCDSSFNLYVTPPMTVLDPQKTFWASSLSPASVVYINLKSSPTVKTPVLKKLILEMAQPFPIAENTIAVDQNISSGIENTADSEEFRVSKTVVVGEETLSSQENVETSKKKLPKWLKFNKS